MLTLRLHVEAFIDLLQCNSFMGVKSNMKTLQEILEFSWYPRLEYRCWKVYYCLCRKTYSWRHILFQARYT